MFFGNLEVDRQNVQTLVAITLLAIAGLIIILPALISPFFEPLPKMDAESKTEIVRVASGEEMINLLKENDLWELNDNGAVPPLLLASYPEDLDEFTIGVKKKLFFHGLLPVALTALEEVREEKEMLRTILAKFPEGYRHPVFSDDFAVWGKILSSEEIDFILALTRKYRTRRAAELVRRVDLLPLSMILAQAAIESSWGTSRFARKGNNLFGVWTWGEKGIIPELREEGKKHKVAAYDTILESVRAYILNLNRLAAYRELRLLRRFTMNPLKLADGLLFYSQRRDSYVWEIKNLIKFNNLIQYDQCFLAGRPGEDEKMKLVYKLI
ncbi:MAG: glucosaminidase domain-containing protein [Desulfobulbales bacterium]|nr:glucosaminidase domain-containing protein [Desulfobulbales bacterium]